MHEAPITLFITRERKEHANLFHAMTDFLNAYQALHMLGVIDARREGYVARSAVAGSARRDIDCGRHRDGMENVGVVLLDEQPEVCMTATRCVCVCVCVCVCPWVRGVAFIVWTMAALICAPTHGRARSTWCLIMCFRPTFP